MKKDINGWIDPATARRLMLEYRQAVGIKGGSEIERQIHSHTKLGLHRKTIENWLRDPNSVASPQTLKIILRFLHTSHFQQIVSRTRDYLDADARLHRVGTALFHLHGAIEVSPAELKARNDHLAGWWEYDPNKSKQKFAPVRREFYLYVSPIEGQPFSKLYFSINKPDFRKGTGLVFPRSNTEFVDYAIRVWSKGKVLNERVASITQDIFQMEIIKDEIYFWYETSQNEYEDSYSEAGSTATFHFVRTEENAVPIGIRLLFEAWGPDVMPHNVFRRSPF
ncbi:hypothetical protein [Eoetvoesiella caeni]